MEKIYLAIAEDNKLMRDGLSLIMKTNPKYELIHVAKNGQELIQKIEDRKTLPDIILMDIDMPKIDGFEACTQITTKHKEVGVIFLTAHISEAFVKKAILAGGHGYISKDASTEEVFEAIDEVFTNGYYYNEHIDIDSIKLMIQNGTITQKFSKNVSLSQEEVEYIKSLCFENTGASNRSEVLEHDNSETSRKKLLDKIGAKKSIELAIYATQKNLL